MGVKRGSTNTGKSGPDQARIPGIKGETDLGYQSFLILHLWEPLYQECDCVRNLFIIQCRYNGSVGAEAYRGGLRTHVLFYDILPLAYTPMFHPKHCPCTHGDSMTDRYNIEGEEVIRRKVTKYGNSGKAGVPKDWIGRDVKIVLLPM